MTTLCRIAISCLAILTTRQLLASTYYVDANRPDDNGAGTSWASAKKTIQAAVNQTVDGDTVLVTNGVYNEGTTLIPGNHLKNRVAITNAITVRSVNGAEATIIEGSGISTYATANAIRCVYMKRGVLDGFTCRYGVTETHQTYDRHMDPSGGGVCMGESDPGTEARNCIIRDCKAYNGGGVIWGSAVNCLIFNNIGMYGGGAYLTDLRNCTVSKNSAVYFGGGVLQCTNVFNSVSVANTAPSGGNYRDSVLTFSCALPLPAGLGNIAADPLFMNSTSNDFRLTESSPCRNSGSNTFVSLPNDLRGNSRILDGIVDMGAYEYGVPPTNDLTAGLQLFYPFTKDSDGAADLSGNGHTGVLHGTTWTYEGTHPGSRLFGDGNYIDVGNSVNFAAWEQFSISVWFKRDTSTGDTTGYGDKLFCKTDWYSDQSLRMIRDGSIHFMVATGGGPYPTVGYGLPCWQDFRDNTWHHVAVIRNGTHAEMWVDGCIRATTDAAVTISSNTKPIYLGYSPAGDSFQRRYWPGNIDEFRIYNRALSSNEVAMLHQQATPCTVSFNAGVVVSPASMIVTNGLAYGDLPTPVRTGYTFGAWQATTGGVAFAVTPATVVTIESDHTLTATWTANSYTVTFDAEGGTVTPGSGTVTFDSAYGELPVPNTPPTARLPYTFDGWQTAGGQTVTADTPVATAGDHTLHARWTAPAYLSDPADDDLFSGAGAYDGYLFAEQAFGDRSAVAVLGTFSLNVTSLAGKFTAKAVTRNGLLAFNNLAWGSVDAGDGTCSATVTLKGGERLDLHVRQNRIWGTLSGGSLGDGTLTLDGARNRFKDRADAAAQAVLAAFSGYYTASLPVREALALGAADAAPLGTGYLTLQIGAGGSAKVAGVLADGTSLSMSSRALLFADAEGWLCVPLFSQIYAKKGWLGGLLWVNPDTRAVVTDRELGWVLRWEQAKGTPADFAELLDVCGGFYAKPPALAPAYRFGTAISPVPYFFTGGSVDFVAEALPLDLGVTVTAAGMAIGKGVSPQLTAAGYLYDGPNSALATLRFTPQTGVFRGLFYVYYDYLFNGRLQHKKVQVPYAGVITPVRGDAFGDEPAGAGHCLVPDNDPLVKPYNLKRSYPATLETVKR